jgi:site-specific recombinase XerD
VPIFIINRHANWPLPAAGPARQTGIRLSELATLKLEDIDFENRLVTVRQGKGRRDRQIPLVEEEVKALRNYLRYRTTELILDDDTLFLAKNGTSLNVSSVKAIVAKYVKKAGIRKRVSVHTLRHTFGAHKADKHMSIATLQALMGHKRKETTLKYIHLARTNLRKEMVETARDCRRIGGQAAIAIGEDRSLAGWNFCPKPEPSVPL